MPPKRTQKANLKLKTHAKVMAARNIGTKKKGHSAAIKKKLSVDIKKGKLDTKKNRPNEVKKKGRAGKKIAKTEEASHILSLEDIVKVKNVSTCDVCGGVWFSRELFDKHLLSCGVQNTLQPAFSNPNTNRVGCTNETDVSVMATDKISSAADKIKAAENKQLIPSITKSENREVLQSFMSNKVQSLLFATKTQISLEKSPEFIPYTEKDNSKPFENGVSISALNLRKNIASSLLKVSPSPLRPTRSLDLFPDNNPAAAEDNFVATIEVNPVHILPDNENDDSDEPFQAVSNLTSRKSRKPHLVRKLNTGFPSNSEAAVQNLTNTTVTKEEKLAPRRGRSGKSNEVLVKELPTPKKIRGHKPATERNLKNHPDSIESIKDFASNIGCVPTFKRQKFQNEKDSNFVENEDDVIIIEKNQTKEKDAPVDLVHIEEREAVNILSSQATESAGVPVSRNTTNDQMRNRQDEVIYDPSNDNIVLSGTPIILTPLQPIKQEIESDEKSTLHSEIFGTGDGNINVPSSSTTSANQVANVDPNAVAFTCAVCQRPFTRKYHLDRHLRISRCSGLPLPSFPCELCNRVYTRKDNLREHLRSHTGEVHRRKNHKCPYCDKAFHGQSLLAIHVRKHTGEKPFACDFCPKRFPSTGALGKHRMTHTGEKPYNCNECGRRFTLKGTLSRHLRTHTGVRPHTCTFCGKKFIQIGGLNAHMFYHTGENGFKCEDCGKEFNRKARLQMHQLYVHIKLKPFTCEHCTKPFTRKEDLMRHSVLHTGEKPFQCPTCDRRFSVKPSLKLHLLTHTKEEPRSCHECGRAFIRKDCLLRHMRKRHREVFDRLFFDEKDEKDSSIVNTRVLSEKDLTENIRELLYLLIDEPTLVGFGWPDKAVDEILELVIQRCGHTPVSRDLYNYMDRLRENAKLLFTVVIDDNAVKTLLNNQTVDEVILHVLRLAKT